MKQFFFVVSGGAACAAVILGVKGYFGDAFIISLISAITGATAWGIEDLDGD